LELRIHDDDGVGARQKAHVAALSVDNVHAARELLPAKHVVRLARLVVGSRRRFRLCERERRKKQQHRCPECGAHRNPPRARGYPARAAAGSEFGTGGDAARAKSAAGRPTVRAWLTRLCTSCTGSMAEACGADERGMTTNCITRCTAAPYANPQITGWRTSAGMRRLART